MFRVVIHIETGAARSYNGRIVNAAAVVLDEQFREVDHFRTASLRREDGLGKPSGDVVPSRNEAEPTNPEMEAAKAVQAFLARFYGATLHAFGGLERKALAREPWLISKGRWGECVRGASMAAMEEAGALERCPDGGPKWPSLDDAARFFEVPRGGDAGALDVARTASLVLARILRSRAEIGAFEDEARMIIEDL